MRKMVENVIVLCPDCNPPKYDIIWWETVKTFWNGTQRVMKVEQFGSYEKALNFYNEKKAMESKESQQ